MHIISFSRMAVATKRSRLAYLALAHLRVVLVALPLDRPSDRSRYCPSMIDFTLTSNKVTAYIRSARFRTQAHCHLKFETL